MAASEQAIMTLHLYHLGVAKTLGAKFDPDPQNPQSGNLYLTVPGVAYPEELKGVPIYFEIPDDLFVADKLPAVIIRCTDFDPALERWHPGQTQYRIPPAYADPAASPDTPEIGFSHYEERPQAWPFDIRYSILLIARNRGSTLGGPLPESHALLLYAMKRLPPYATIHCNDSLGGCRTYEGRTTYSTQDQVIDVTGRTTAYELQLRVLAELDLAEAEAFKSVEQRSFTYTILEA